MEATRHREYPVDVRVQHAAKQGNASHPSPNFWVGVHASDTFQKRCQSPHCHRTLKRFAAIAAVNVMPVRVIVQACF
jgi:hypothetical protein